MWYPLCKDGFKSVGCCICSPKCVNGMRDTGIACLRNSYGRGRVSPLVCANGLQLDRALCYTPCNSGFTSGGPVCW